MYQYLVANPVLAVIFIVLIVAVVVFLAVKAIQKIGLEKIRAVVYQGFLKAEHEFQYGDNTQKFEYVIQLARSSIPAPFNMFITESLLRKVVQLWFDLIKDLLDDGKMNGTGQSTPQEERCYEFNWKHYRRANLELSHEQD